MTNETQTFAGLSRNEADKALCAWLKERAPEVLQQYRMPFCPYPRMTESVVESHDSIHRVLDAMNRKEVRTYAERLCEAVMGKTEWAFAEATPTEVRLKCLRATPAQKTVAALRALGLEGVLSIETTPEQPKVSAIGHFRYRVGAEICTATIRCTYDETAAQWQATCRGFHPEAEFVSARIEVEPYQFGAFSRLNPDDYPEKEVKP